MRRQGRGSIIFLLLLIGLAPVIGRAEPAEADPLRLARLAADWQLAHPAEGQKESAAPQGWVQAVFYIGLTALAEHEARYGDIVKAHGEALSWRLGPRAFDADDQAIGQSYAWVAQHFAMPAALTPTREQFAAILVDPPQGDMSYGNVAGGKGKGLCRSRWCWCDALFMAPPLWLDLARVTGDPSYADFADREFAAAEAVLYDPDEHLFFRDSRFRNRQDENGKKIFWSRGNGWVLAGLARLLDRLPANHPRRDHYRDLFRAMSVRLIELQKPDGFWPSSLLGGQAISEPESSGTGLIVYGLAWGVRQGVLPDPASRTAVERGWKALSQTVKSDGRLTWVQPSGDAPGPVAERDTQPYGVGAFLMAASAVSELPTTKYVQ